MHHQRPSSGYLPACLAVVLVHGRSLALPGSRCSICSSSASAGGGSPGSRAARSCFGTGRKRSFAKSGAAASPGQSCVLRPPNRDATLPSWSMSLSPGSSGEPPAEHYDVHGSTKTRINFICAEAAVQGRQPHELVDVALPRQQLRAACGRRVHHGIYHEVYKLGSINKYHSMALGECDDGSPWIWLKSCGWLKLQLCFPKDVPYKIRTQELRKGAAPGPDVDGAAVTPAAQQQLRRAVPPRRHRCRVAACFRVCCRRCVYRLCRCCAACRVCCPQAAAAWSTRVRASAVGRRRARSCRVCVFVAGHRGSSSRGVRAGLAKVGKRQGAILPQQQVCRLHVPVQHACIP